MQTQILSIFLILLNLCGMAQVNLVNDTIYTVPFEGGGSNILFTNDSNYIINTFNQSSTGVFVSTGFLKLNNKGEQLQFKNFSTGNSSIQSGGYGTCMLKSTENNLEYYYTVGVRSLSKDAFWVIKNDKNLDSVFTITIKNDSMDIRARSVAQIDSSSFILIGESGNWQTNEGPNNNTDIYMAKISSNGNLIWHKRIKTTNYSEFPWSIEYVDSGKIIIAGYRTSATVNDRATFWVLDTSGTILKTKQLTVSNLTGINVMKKLSDGNFIAGGSYNVNQSIKNCPTSFKHFVVKIDENLNVIWQKQYNFAPPSCNNIISSIEELPNGDLMFCGAMGEFNTTDSVWQGLGLIFKTRADGSPIWYKTYDRRQDFASYNYATVYDIVALGDTGFACSGWFSASKQPIWFLKTDSLGCDNTDSCSPPIWVGLSKVNNIKNLNSISLFPNPANSKLYIQLNNTSLDFSGTIQLFNCLGQENLVNIINSNNQEIDISNLNTGVYQVILKDPDGMIISAKSLIISR